MIKNPIPFSFAWKKGKEESFEEIIPGISLEFDNNNEIIGIEILKASRFSDNLKAPVTVKHWNS